MRHYEAVVIGCGGLGSAALYWLSREVGAGALGIEQFRLGHDRGASQDHSRIIRLAQHHSDYAALVPEAYEAFYEIEGESGQQVVFKTGGLVIEATGEPERAKLGGRNIDPYVSVLEEHGFDYELLGAEEVMSRWPQFDLEGSERAIYQKDTGIVDARRANAIHAALARARGARILEETPVRTVRPNGEGVEVVTDEGRYFADRVVVAADAWTNRVLKEAGVQIPLTTTQEQVTYYATPNLGEFSMERFPVFMWRGAESLWRGAESYYGFPVYGEVATKLGQPMAGPEVSPETRNFEADSVRLERYRQFLSRYIPGFLGPELYTKTCLNTPTPDRKFVIDAVPESPQILVALGAGEAYKFAALIGKILSELALDGTTSFPVEPFSITRPAITDGSFEGHFMADSTPVGPRMGAPTDRRALGQTNTLLECGVDLERMRRERLSKVQAEMEARDIGALLLTDAINIRYATGVSVFPIWSASNLARYALVPAEGSPVVFEMAEAKFRAEEFFSDVRNAYHWQARFAERMAPERSGEWAAEIRAVLKQWGVGDARLGVDHLDYYGFAALKEQRLHLTDADEPMEAARIIKTEDEIELLRQSAAVCEAALHDLEQAIRPGVSEHELLGVFHHKMQSLGGEHCFTRLLCSGYKTNPWFHEAGSKLVRPGDLVAFDTGMIGPEGYACDISRTFLCGGRARVEQREAYKVALEFTQELAGRLRPGLSYAELAESLPGYPEDYRQQRYPFILHGVGTDDEPPFLPFPDEPEARVPEGELRENMVVSVEFYAGRVGGQDGVKLEDEV